MNAVFESPLGGVADTPLAAPSDGCVCKTLGGYLVVKEKVGLRPPYIATRVVQQLQKQTFIVLVNRAGTSDSRTRLECQRCCMRDST